MFKCDCIDPVFFHRRGRKARREGIFDYLCDLCALSGEMWVITNTLGIADCGFSSNTFQISDVQTSEVSEVSLAGQVQAHLRPIMLPSPCGEDLRGLI